MSVPILTTTPEVENLASELARHRIIAIDLEADSMHSYTEKVCLLQFSTPEKTWLVDPLAGADLTPLKSVLADPEVRKIFHAADYDIRCLYRDFEIEIAGLFDTMISSQFLGEEKIGLADMLGKYFGVELDKQYQRADWAARPLSEGMIAYAAEDTRHLHRLAEMLEERLVAKGRLEWVAEEFALLEQVRHSGNDGPLFLRAKGAAVLTPRQLAALENLLQWRETEAQRRDVPPFKVIGNKALMEVARILPRALKALVGIEGLPPRLADRYGRSLLQQVESAMAMPENDLPVYPRTERRVRDPEAERRLNLLKNWRKKKAAELQIDPGVLINNAALEEISRRNPRNASDLSGISLLKNWQRQVLGEGILRAL